MEKYELLFELYRKQNKTQIEEMLLRYDKILTIITEILVDESKKHRTSEKAIEDIREYLNKNM